AANVDAFGRNLRSAIRRHWVLFLIPGVAMVILGFLAAASPFIATTVVETFAGWLFLTGGFIWLSAPVPTPPPPAFLCSPCRSSSAPFWFGHLLPGSSP